MQRQILGEAKRLFQQYGLAKVTMDDVARALGKGRSSLYYYYKSKEEIFDAVVMIEIDEMVAAMRLAVEKVSGVEEKLHVFFLTKLEVLREKRAFFKTLDVGMDADALSKFQRTKIVHHNEIMKKEGDLLCQLLTGGIEKGELRKMEGAEMEMVIFVLLSSLRGIKREMEMGSDFEKAVSAVGTLARMVIGGMKR